MERVSSYSCAYRHCKNSRGNTSAISFYGFPVKNIERCKKWIINSGNLTLIKNIDNLDLVKSLKICEKHFTSQSFNAVSASRKTLIKNAIPVKYMDVEDKGK